LGQRVAGQAAQAIARRLDLDAAAGRAALGHRLLPGGPLAGRVGGAAVEGALRLRALLHEVGAAGRTGHADLHLQRLRVAALGEAGAGQEAAEAPQLDDHVAAALLADLLGRLVGRLHAADRLLGDLQFAVERLVELADDRHPRPAALGDLVQLLLHVRGEVHVHHVAEVLDQQVVYEHTELGRAQALLHALDVTALLDRRQRGCVSGRATDAALLQRLHQRGLRVARRRLGEVLLGQQRQQVQLLALGERRQRLALLVRDRRVVAALGVDRQEAGEFEPRAGRAEEELVGGVPRRRRLDLDGRHVEARRRHLARHEALPDQLVQAELLGREPRLDGRRLAVDRGGADRLVRLLR